MPNCLRVVTWRKKTTNKLIRNYGKITDVYIYIYICISVNIEAMLVHDHLMHTIGIRCV